MKEGPSGSAIRPVVRAMMEADGVNPHELATMFSKWSSGSGPLDVMKVLKTTEGIKKIDKPLSKNEDSVH